ncbi:Polysaccharide biosynthesis protein [Lachnospiraceae bacterium NE2001]|nr:Polysaccharide biosynthesis protein [Lachnospiraceae bacterium NE2001]
MFNLELFIAENVTKRNESMFSQDIEDNKENIRKSIDNKSILVIGGAGSIGSSFIRQILRFNPSSLVVVDINENALAELTRDLRSTEDLNVPKEYITYPMDFASLVFGKMFRKHKGFDIVANFSAHKHVRTEKDIFSIEALIRNNLINAKKLLDLLSEFPPEMYFCVSTDKAANPVNIMGASKRIMEDLIFSYSDRFPVKTARFANVAFSNGSLPAGFLSRIQKFQPLSAPTDVMRYFVSPEESGQICLLSCILGENRAIFFPKLKEAQMMSFDDIARQLLNACGFDTFECCSDEEAVREAKKLRNGSKQYPVHFSVSDTSGEKDYEEFYTTDECIDMDRFRALGVITEKGIPDKCSIEDLFNDLENAFSNDIVDKNDIVSMLKKYLPGFTHIETGKSLDEKM